MRAIEIARRMVELGSYEDACRAYTLAIHESAGQAPAEEMEAALYLLQTGGSYKSAYTCFRDLYNRGFYREDCLNIMTEAFYKPNVKTLRSRYERNCKLLERYPYLFRKDFPDFNHLPIKLYPFGTRGFLHFYVREERFGEYINVNHAVVSRNFFRDLEKPILAAEVYSQYELEYLNDNVRKSEYLGRENHIYLHYPDWETFCSYLQCFNMRKLLGDKKFVFLIGDEIEQYPIDFKERFGIEFGDGKPKPIGIREVHRLIWHAQLSTHNGGDFFNEIFDAHPNLLAETSLMFDSMESMVEDVERILREEQSVQGAVKRFVGWDTRVISELYLLKNRTAKDIFVARFLSDTLVKERENGAWLDPDSRIAPAMFFQPHFHNIIYSIYADSKNRTTLKSEQYDAICNSPLFREFKYIKTFVPMRRLTTSHGGTVRFMNAGAERGEGVVGDAVSQRILNRSFMMDWQNRIYQDSVLVRFEDGKLNPKATFTALAAFLDLPYAGSMTYCSEWGKPLDYGGYISGGFDPKPVYKTYDDFVNDSERFFIEYFLRDAYEYYGYDFLSYDGREMDLELAKTLIENFSTMNQYIRSSWIRYAAKRIGEKNEDLSEEKIAEAAAQTADDEIVKTTARRLNTAGLLLRGLRFVNPVGQELHMIPKLELDPALLEQPLYH